MDTDGIICDAVKAFESTIYNADGKELGSLSIQNVVDAARIIEREREDRDALCNFRRIDPLLKELQILGEVIRKLPQSSYPDHYLWVCRVFVRTTQC